MTSQRKLRILMLHGYKQNKELFYERTGSVRKMLKKYAEFFYCEAPHVIPGDPQSLNEVVERGWWLKSSDWPELNAINFDADFETTLECLDSFMEKNGPFDGLFGFSQAGTLVSLLGRTEHLTKYKNIKFEFGIISATCKSSEEKHEIFYDLNKKVTMPTLHIIGKADKLVNLEKSLELTNYFVEPRVFLHELGHCIPWNAEAKQVYVQFFEDMMKRI
jgi:hypothetical protein